MAIELQRLSWLPIYLSRSDREIHQLDELMNPQLGDIGGISKIGAIWDPLPNTTQSQPTQSRCNFENFAEISPLYDTALTPHAFS